jgi:hypothetical protein
MGVMHVIDQLNNKFMDFVLEARRREQEFRLRVD